MSVFGRGGEPQGTYSPGAPEGSPSLFRCTLSLLQALGVSPSRAPQRQAAKEFLFCF